MAYFFYTNALGTYIFDESAKLVKKNTFKATYENLKTLAHGDYIREEEQLINEFKGKDMISLVNKNSHNLVSRPNLFNPTVMKTFTKIIRQFSTKEHFAMLRDIDIDFSAEMLRRHPPTDNMIIQAVNGLDEYDKVINMLSTRLREWFSLYNPELSKKINDHRYYAEEVLKLERPADSIGAKISKKDLNPIKDLANSVLSLHKAKAEQESYLVSLMEETYPNIAAVATPLLAARLISFSGSMKRLVNFPSSTIQTLGAEKAMFRHLKTTSNPPKHGIIVLHPLVNDAKRTDKGKVARALASKITIAAKIDFFGGDAHMGYQLRQELENNLA
ncbi:MAG: NOP5/NOP56 family protein [Candidatus Woesearchaeota archaeon]